MDHQDWNPIILKSLKAKKTIVDKKQIVKINPNSNSIGKINARKVEESEDMKTVYVSKSIGKQIQQARTIQKITQQDLANKLCVKKNIINDLESGKMLKNNSFVNKVKAYLKII